MPASRTLEEALLLLRQRVGSSLDQATRADIFPHAAPSSTGVWEGTARGCGPAGSGRVSCGRKPH